MAPTPPYVELHCHSAYSFLDGVSLPQELAQRAGELGHGARDRSRQAEGRQRDAVLGVADREPPHRRDVEPVERRGAEQRRQQPEPESEVRRDQ
jgi:DNA polymerase III, alpha subunit